MLISVNSSDGLVAALKTAHSGDTVQLAAGTYAPALIRNLTFDGNVTITSKDPANQAVVTGLDIRNVQGLTIQGLKVYADPANGENPLNLINSSNIHYDHLTVYGTVDGNYNNDVGSMLIRNSSNVTVTNSEFHDLHFGVAHLDSNNVVIADNNFHDIRTDAVRGGGTSNITVKNNVFTDFHPAAGDHADAIQFWTSGTTASAHDINVTGNLILRGQGDAVQGIFFRDQVGDLPYQKVNISDNLVVGSLYRGISLSSADYVTVANNQVVGLPDQASWLTVTDANHVTLTNNKATTYALSDNTDVTETKDTTIASPLDGGKAAVSAWMLTHGADLSPLISTTTISSAAAKSVAVMTATRLEAMTVNGTAAADHLTVDGVHDTVLNGGAGNDMLTGGGFAHNTLVGGAGDDIFTVYTSHDVVAENAGEGTDMVVAYTDFVLPDNVENLRMMTGAEIGVGNALANRITGTSGDDQIQGLGGDDQLQSGDGNDSVEGGDGADTISAGGGADSVTGGTGNDKITGDEGSDSISGGAGADTIEGGAGADTVSGGAGADMFNFRAGDIAKGDTILDFSHADGDKIALNGIDANSVMAGDQKFSFIGTSAFHHVAGELRYEVVNGDANVLGDVNGDGVADFSLHLTHVGSLTSGDFIL